MTTDHVRLEALRDLIELRPSLGAALERVADVPWPGEYLGVTLSADDLRRALDRFDADELSAADLERWAEEIHGREDIELEPADRDLLADALFELSTPELFGSMAEIVRTIRARLA